MQQIPHRFFDNATQEIADGRQAAEALHAREEAEESFSSQLKALLDIGNELSKVGSVDGLCRLAVELGRKRLGFDRIGIWLMDHKDPQFVVGTWAVDENGQVRDERDCRTSVDANAAIETLVLHKKRFALLSDGPPHDAELNVIGRGTNVAAALWDGEEVIGYVAADNLLEGRPISDRDCELLILYASTLGHLYKRKRAEEAMRAIVQGTVATTGEAFFRSLVRHLASALNVRHALVAELVGEGRARTLAIWTESAFEENFEYCLAGTPSDEVASHGICLYPRGIRPQFPDDPFLQKSEVESYHGTSLRDAAGNTVGLLAIMDVAPISEAPLRWDLLTILASRAATELSRMRAEAALKLDEERLEALMKLSRMPGVSEGEIIDFALEEGVRLTGSKIGFLHFIGENQKVIERHSRPKDLSKKWSAGNAPHFPMEEADVWADCVREKKPVIHNDCQKHAGGKDCPYGHTEILRYTGVPIVDGESVVGVAGVGNKEESYDQSDVRQLSLFMNSMWEILKRKRAEEELRKREAHQALVLSSLPMAFYTAEPSGVYGLTWASEQIEQVTGFTAEEFEQNRDLWASRLHAEDRELVLGEFAGLREKESIEVEYRWQAADSHYLWLLDRAVLVRDGDGAPKEIVGTWLDITERRRLEEQLGHAQRMETIGRLAGGVAHDFNNLLTVIGGYCDMALDRIDPDAGLAEDLGEIRSAGERAAALTQQLLAFSRRQIIQPQVLDLNAMVTTTRKMLQRLIGENIELLLDLGPDTGFVKADPGQLEQVILNLAVNARDAMPHGGALMIGTSSIDLNDGHSQSGVRVRPGPYAVLSVSDTGMGMDEETRVHVFEPFFTTKEKNRGTGLGLSTVYGIVKQSEGYVWVHSESGKGTSFKVYLPRVEEAPESIRRPENAVELPRGDETVLLVEDDGAVRSLAAEILGQYGYRILEAENGDEALRLMDRQVSETIDLVLTDVIMPRMGGRVLAERLKANHPEIKVLYTSGYTDDAIAEQGVLESGIAFLLKPFTPGGLLRKVREVLDSGGAGEAGAKTQEKGLREN